MTQNAKSGCTCDPGCGNGDRPPACGCGVCEAKWKKDHPFITKATEYWPNLIADAKKQCPDPKIIDWDAIDESSAAMMLMELAISCFAQHLDKEK